MDPKLDVDVHLNSDQLLRAVVGESDLPRGLRIHLKQCPPCRQEVDRLATRFGAIGRMAREISPDALGRVRLPDRQRRFFLGRRVGLRPALGMALAMVLLMMIVLYRPMGHRSTPVVAQLVERAESNLDPEAEAQLLAEIHALLSNPLPEEYQQFAGEDGAGGDLGDPTEFIVPDLEGETDEEIGHANHLKGTA